MTGAEEENARIQANAYVEAVERQTHAAEENQRLLAAYLKDTQANLSRAPEHSAEYMRAARHHDVLRDTLHQLVAHGISNGMTIDADKFAQAAHLVADAAYPQPKPFDHALVNELLKDQEK